MVDLTMLGGKISPYNYPFRGLIITLISIVTTQNKHVIN